MPARGRAGRQSFAYDDRKIVDARTADTAPNRLSCGRKEIGQADAVGRHMGMRQRPDEPRIATDFAPPSVPRCGARDRLTGEGSYRDLDRRDGTPANAMDPPFSCRAQLNCVVGGGDEFGRGWVAGLADGSTVRSPVEPMVGWLVGSGRQWRGRAWCRRVVAARPVARASGRAGAG
jgi:hypothetical protein